MAFWWFFWKRRVRHYRCPDGSTRAVYADFNEVFPLHIAGYEDKTSGSINAAKQVEAKVSAEHKETAKALLFQINRLNQSQQQHLRAAYALYSAAPCEALHYFADAVREAREFEARLTLADTILQAIISLISKPGAKGILLPNGEDPISQFLRRAFDALTSPSYIPSVVNEFRAVSQYAEEWRRVPNA